MSAIPRAALSGPAVVGVKVTPMVQLDPAASEPGQLFACAKSLPFAPAIVMPAIVSAALPALASVTVWAALVVPTAWFP